LKPRLKFISKNFFFVQFKTKWSKIRVQYPFKPNRKLNVGLKYEIIWLRKKRITSHQNKIKWIIKELYYQTFCTQSINALH